MDALHKTYVAMQQNPDLAEHDAKSLALYLVSEGLERSRGGRMNFGRSPRLLHTSSLFQMPSMSCRLRGNLKTQIPAPLLAIRTPGI